MKKVFTLIALFVSVLTMNAQVKTIVSPEKSVLETIRVIKDHKKAKQVKKFAPFDVQKMLYEDATDEGIDIPFRFGKGFETNITLSNGDWTKVENGRLWSMEFESTGAYSINFVFNNFYLPEGAELYITNREETMLYGPVTSEQNTKNGFFLTDLVQGDNVTLYLFEPVDKQGQAKLTIKRVVHAYKDLFPNRAYGNYGNSGSCNINVENFPAWDLESDAVGLVLLASGTEWCSGSLVMTANQSFKPFFLTAFHCIDTNVNGSLTPAEVSNAENWMFKFQYKQSSRTSAITYNGAAFKAAWNTTDFALMEMEKSPVEGSRFSFLGWDRSGNTPTSGVGIHHPSGDVMKISFDNNQLLETNNNSNFGNSHWRVQWDNGVTEGGSSGSPLFNQNKRVIGQLHGGWSACGSSDMRDWYGCFHRSWTGGGTNTTRLSNWLDPTNTGVMTTNTLRPPSISGPTLVLNNGSTYTLSGGSGGTVTWTYSTNLQILSSSNTSITVESLSASAGAGWIQASVGGASTPRYEVWAGKPVITGIYGETLITHPGENVYYYAQYNEKAAITSFDWVFVQGIDPTFWSSTSKNWIYHFFYEDSYQLFVRGTNANGTGNYCIISITADFPGMSPSPPSLYRVSQDPASNELTVSPDTSVSQLSPLSPSSGAATNNYTVYLYNTGGAVVKQAVSRQGGEVRLDVSGLPNGIYYLLIDAGNGTKPESHKIIINH